MSIVQVVADYRRRLIDREDRAVADITRAYKVAHDSISREMIRTLEDIDRAGPNAPVSWLYSTGRYEELLRQSTFQLNQWAGLTGRYIESGQSDAVALAMSAMPEYFAARGPSLSIAGQFERLPIEALQHFVGRTQDGSPLVDTFAQYGRRGSEIVGDTMIEALALGQNPREAARLLTRRLDDPEVILPGKFADGEAGLERLKNRAVLTTRNEIVSSNRGAALENYAANDDILTGWIWIATLDVRTCPVCWAMHGSKHGHGEPFGSHVQCRCTPVPDFESARPITTGPVLFDRLDREDQRVILGPTKLELYEAGAPLKTFVFFNEDERWGPQRTEASAERARLRLVNGGGTPPTVGGDGGNGGGGDDGWDDQSRALFVGDLVADFDRGPSPTKRERVREVFGEDKTPQEIAQFFAAPVGSKTKVYTKKGEVAAEIVKGSQVYHYSTATTKSGELTVIFGELEVSPRGEGVGARVFARLVKNAKRAGAVAVAGYADRPNGFYSWVRMGMVMDIQPGTLARLRAVGLEPVNQEAENIVVKTTTDLFLKFGIAGLIWWKENGHPGKVVLDLSDDSLEFEIFEAYLEEKGIRQP